MLKAWWKHITVGSEYQGIEIFEVNNELKYSYLTVKQKKNELFVTSKKTLSTTDVLGKLIEKNKVLFLILNTAQVLGKSVANVNEIKPEQALIEAYPNLEIDNFYYQVIKLGDTKRVSICKKIYFDGLIEEVNAKGIFPSEVALGISTVQNITDYFTEEEIEGSNFVLSDSFTIKPKEGYTESSLKFGDIELSSNFLLSFAQIVGYLANNKITGNLFAHNNKWHNEFKNQRVFQLGLRFSLIAFLSLLLINFLFYSSYQSKLQESEMGVGAEQELQLLTTIENRVSLKEEKVKQASLNGNSRASFYLDKIAFEIPNSIQLDELIYQPTLKPVRDGKPIELNEQVISISGVTKNKSEFTTWTSNLEQKDWIDNVTYESYEFVSSSKDRFTILISLHAAE